MQYTEITQDDLIADCQKHLGTGLHKQCDGAGCGYTQTGICRVYGEGKICMAKANADNYAKEKRNIDNPFILQAKNRLLAEQVLRAVVLGEGEDGLA